MYVSIEFVFNCRLANILFIKSMKQRHIWDYSNWSQAHKTYLKLFPFKVLHGQCPPFFLLIVKSVSVVTGEFVTEI